MTMKNCDASKRSAKKGKIDKHRGVVRAHEVGDVNGHRLSSS